MNNVELKQKLMPLGATSRILKIPSAWLRQEAEEGRIPHIKAGDTLLLIPGLVEKILVDRVQKQQENNITGGLSPQK